MTAQPSAQVESLIAGRLVPSAAWTTTWTTTPPTDWDEIRARLRSLHAPKRQSRRAQPAALPKPAGPPPLELLRGPQPCRVSWREAQRTPPTLLRTVGAILQRIVSQIHIPHWWREHDPLTVQRTLLVITLLLGILVTLQVR